VRRFELPAGSFVIIPATFEAGVESHFMMRAYSEGPMEIRELRDCGQSELTVYGTVHNTWDYSLRIRELGTVPTTK
jgi:hypothetical protein